jgi:hypothetical protein
MNQKYVFLKTMLFQVRTYGQYPEFYLALQLLHTDKKDDQTSW